MRVDVTLQCSECNRGNYRTTRNKTAGKKLKLSKFCPYCQQHTEHKEK
ncbi:MAG: 50S ribosomal protein L33 [Planctomycetota bacterium]